MLSFPYEPEVARIVAARFIMNEGGKMNYTKLMKLMYLLERRSLVENSSPVVGGRYVAMDNGPLISEAYDAVKGDAWQGIERDGYDVIWKGSPAETEDYLSEREETMLDELSDFFRKYSYGAMIEYTHDESNCPEWKEHYTPNSSAQIPLRSIPGCDADELEAYAREMSVFASAR